MAACSSALTLSSSVTVFLRLSCATCRSFSRSVILSEAAISTLYCSIGIWDVCSLVRKKASTVIPVSEPRRSRIGCATSEISSLFPSIWTGIPA